MLLESAAAHHEIHSQKQAIIITFSDTGEMRLWSTCISAARLALAGAVLTDDALSEADVNGSD